MPTDSPPPQENRDWIFDRAASTDFTAAQDEIDARLAADAPDHPDSVELRRLLRESERASEVATALLLALEQCLPIEGRCEKITEKTARITGTKLITLLWMLRSEKLNLARIGQSQIAEGLGCTRALISHYTRFWNKATGLRCRQQKLASASDSYRAASVRGWAKRRGEEIDASDPLDHAGGEPFKAPHCGDDEEQEISDDYTPSWSRGRGDDDDLDAVAD
jgi:hypothetical protein